MRKVVSLVVLCLVAWAWAVELTVQTGEGGRLEYRPVKLPGGETTDLIVITGDPVNITIENDKLTANYIEYDRVNKLLRVVGPGTYRTEEETVTGEDFIIDLSSERFSSRDVLIFTEAIDVVGVEATRAPGQIDVIGGAFSPCSRCSQEVQDYGFRAERLTLYPGDRLIAYEVTILIRNVAVLGVPLLVLPLGPVEKQPRLLVNSGDADTRAGVSLAWPYVVGPNAYGTTTLNYYADVLPAGGNPLTRALLGGGVETSYFGGELDHRFLTETGEGGFRLAYTPSFIAKAGERPFEEGKTRDEFGLRFFYESYEGLEDPFVLFLIERDDERKQRLVEYLLQLETSRDGVSSTFTSQLYLDLDRDDSVDTPSYAAPRHVPLRTVSRLSFTPEDEEGFRFGPLSVTRLLLDVGLFEDLSNPANRSAASQSRTTAFRVTERHALDLTPQRPWSGMTISGNTSFEGYYYSTAERLVDWKSTLKLVQGIADLGSLNLTFTRNTVEGETPFVFDSKSLFSLTTLDASLNLAPLPWLSLQVKETYVFVDSRRRDLGPGDLQTTLRLFNNVRWLDVSLRNDYDLQEGDPGNLVVEATVRSPNPALEASLTVKHIQDLEPELSRVRNTVVDESETSLNLKLAPDEHLSLEASGGYVYDPVLPETPDEPYEYWKPLVLGLTLGSLDQTDSVPGFSVRYTRDLNRGKPELLAVQASARTGAVEFELKQTFDYAAQRLSVSSFSVLWRGVVKLESSGFAYLPPGPVGFDFSETLDRAFKVQLSDATELQETALWALTYSTIYDPDLTVPDPSLSGGYRDSKLEAKIDARRLRTGDTTFGLEAFSRVRLKDDVLPKTYLDLASLTAATDISGAFGIQGSLRYDAGFDTVNSEISTRVLRIDDLAFTARLHETVYLSAVFDDVWDLTGNDTLRSPWNFQPTFYLTWDRCCWAFYGSWDTETGAVRLGLGAPNQTRGFVQTLDTGLRLPGR